LWSRGIYALLLNLDPRKLERTLEACERSPLCPGRFKPVENGGFNGQLDCVAYRNSTEFRDQSLALPIFEPPTVPLVA